MAQMIRHQPSHRRSSRSQPFRIGIALDLAEPYTQHQDVFLGKLHYARDRPDRRYIVDECPGYYRGRRADLFKHYDGVIARAGPQMQRQLRRQGVPLVNTWHQAFPKSKNI